MTLAIAFCLATLPLLAHADMAKYDLRRIPNEELSFPEEHLDLYKEQEEPMFLDDGNEKIAMKGDEAVVATEDTPLMSDSLNV